MDRLRIAFAMGLPHPPGMRIRDASLRIGAFVEVLRANSKLPHPPLLLRVDQQFEALDGLHRLAALTHAQANGVPLEGLHGVWVAAVNPC